MRKLRNKLIVLAASMSVISVCACGKIIKESDNFFEKELRGKLYVTDQTPVKSEDILNVINKDDFNLEEVIIHSEDNEIQEIEDVQQEIIMENINEEEQAVPILPTTYEELNIMPMNCYGYMRYTTEYVDSENNVCDISEFQKVFIDSFNGSTALVNDENGEMFIVPIDSVDILPSTFIETDLSDKITRLYFNGELINEYIVSIGAGDTPTDIGYFEIFDKNYDRYLDGPGYHTFVNYFFPYNGGEGFHNLPGYDNFGEEASHGCTRMRLEDVSELNDYVTIGTKVLVHK